MVESERSVALVLIGLGLVSFGAILQVQVADSHRDAAPATVGLQITDPRSQPFFNGTVPLEAGNDTVLGALLTASRIHHFSVTLQEYPFQGTMVVEIAGYHNDNPGPCGWVYEINGVFGDRAADEKDVQDKDRVHWYWSCADTGIKKG